MKYCVEIRTIETNGNEVLSRLIVPDENAAQLLAWVLADMMFPDEVSIIQDMSFVRAPWFTNDLGDRVNIRANAYGDEAQITEGMFFLFKGDDHG